MSIIESSYIKKNINDKVNCFKELMDTAKDLNASAYIVGGTVRDILLGVDSIDVDVVPFNIDYLIFAKKFALKINAYYIEFKDNVAIVSRTDKKHIADISKPRGRDIYEDIALRDFTINNLAIDKDYNIIGDISGIESKIIRAVSDNVFISDPIRILRALRLLSTYGFNIDDYTLTLIKRDISLLKSSAGERVHSEVIKFLDGKYLNKAIKYIIDNKLYAEKNTLKLLKKIENSNKLVIAIATIFSIDKFENIADYLKLSNKDRKLVGRLYSAYSDATNLNIDDDYKLFCYKFYYDYELIIAYFCQIDFYDKLDKISIFYKEINMSNADFVNGDILLALGLKPSPIFKDILEKIKLKLVYNDMTFEEIDDYIKKLIKAG